MNSNQDIFYAPELGVEWDKPVTTSTDPTPAGLGSLAERLKQMKDAMEAFRLPDALVMSPDTLKNLRYYDLPSAEIEFEGQRRLGSVRIIESDLVPSGLIAKVKDTQLAIHEASIDFGRTFEPSSIDEPFKLRIEIPKVRLDIDYMNTVLINSLWREDRMPVRKRAAVRRKANRFLQRAHLLTTRKAKRRAVRAIRRDAKAKGISPTVAEVMEEVFGLRGRSK